MCGDSYDEGKDHDSVLVTSLAAEKVGYHLDKDKAIAKY